MLVRFNSAKMLRLLITSLTSNVTVFSTALNPLFAEGGNESGLTATLQIANNTVTGGSLASDFPVTEGYCILLFANERSNTDPLGATRTLSDASITMQRNGGVFFDISSGFQTYQDLATQTGGQSISLPSFTRSPTDTNTALLQGCVQAVVGNCQDLTLPVDQNCVVSKPAASDLFSSDGNISSLVLGGELMNEPSELGTGKTLSDKP